MGNSIAKRDTYVLQCMDNRRHTKSVDDMGGEKRGNNGGSSRHR